MWMQLQMGTEKINLDVKQQLYLFNWAWNRVAAQKIKFVTFHLYLVPRI